jgi:hypothetical protein
MGFSTRVVSRAVLSFSRDMTVSSESTLLVAPGEKARRTHEMPRFGGLGGFF